MTQQLIAAKAKLAEAQTMEGVRLAVVDLFSAAGRFDLPDFRSVVDAASDRLYEIANPDYRKPTGKVVMS